MLDALDVANLPELGWDLLACYVNGANPQSAGNAAAARARFPAAQILGITTDGTMTAAPICDCETGDYNPASAAAWAHWRISQGARPTIYSSRDTWPFVVAQLKLLAVTVAEVDWWASSLDGTTGPTFEIGAGTYTAVAVQYRQQAPGYDVSIVYDDGWYPACPPTHLLTEDTMISSIDGKRIIGNAKDNDNLLVLTEDPPGQWSVIDVTDQLKGKDPTRTYQLQ